MNKLFILILVLGLGPLVSAQADTETNLIVSHGEGEVRVRPDLIQLQVVVRAHGKNASDAQERNGEESADLGKNLREEGVEPKDVQTQNYSVEPRFEYEKGKPVFRGYDAENYLVVRVHKVDALAKILDKIVDGDEEDDKSVAIRGTRFDTELRQDYEGQALAKAVANARARAEALAKAAGRSVKEVRRISDSQVSMNPGPPRPLLRAAMMANGSSSPSAPELAPGEIVVSTSVTVEFGM